MKFVVAVLVAALVCAYVYNDYKHAEVIADPATTIPSPEPPASGGAVEPPRLDPLAGLEPPKLDLPLSMAATPRRYSFRYSPVKDALRTCRGGDDETKKAVEKGLSWLASARRGSAPATAAGPCRRREAPPRGPTSA
jgi:hypothetical protein